MPRAFTDDERELIAKRLLEQGSELFATHGLRKTSVEELARAAGISKGAFYLFYDSKEALFMDAVEHAEQMFRADVLAAIDAPGPSPRARLAGVLREAFTTWRTIPLLRAFNSTDYERLYRRMPVEKLQEHLLSDRAFLQTLIDRCRAAGIPITAPVERVAGLVYALMFVNLHEDDLGQDAGALDVLIELTAAYCLGEISVDA